MPVEDIGQVIRLFPAPRLGAARAPLQPTRISPVVTAELGHQRPLAPHRISLPGRCAPGPSETGSPPDLHVGPGRLREAGLVGRSGEVRVLGLRGGTAFGVREEELGTSEQSQRSRRDLLRLLLCPQCQEFQRGTRVRDMEGESWVGHGRGSAVKGQKIKVDVKKQGLKAGSGRGSQNQGQGGGQKLELGAGARLGQGSV